MSRAVAAFSSRAAKRAKTAVVSGAALLAGCACVSPQEARELDKELLQRNLASREEAVERVAAELGADLLESEMVSLPGGCSGHDGWSAYRRIDCVRIEEVGSGVMRLWSSRGESKLAFMLGQFHDGQAHRLARNEKTLFILTPHAVREKVGEGWRCECDAGLRVYPTQTLALVVDDAPIETVKRLAVSYAHDFIDWDCKALLL